MSRSTAETLLRLEREATTQAERERAKEAELRAAEQQQLELQQRQLAQAEELRRKVDEMIVSLAAAARGDLTVPVTVDGVERTHAANSPIGSHLSPENPMPE